MLNRDENDSEEGTKHDNKVELVDLPNGIRSWDVDKADDGGDNDGSQHEIGSVLKKRHQKQQGYHYRHRHYDIGHCGFGPCIMVHR